MKRKYHGALKETVQQLLLTHTGSPSKPRRLMVRLTDDKTVEK